MKKILILYLLLLVPDKLWAQTSHEFTLPQIALIGIESDNDPILNLGVPSEAGSMNLSVKIDNAARIVYTFALPENAKRRITATTGLGTIIPAGTTFSLKVSDCGSGGGGDTGDGTDGFVVISNDGEAKTIISDIGSSFTGPVGHAIDYKLEVTNMSALRASDSGNITITFTILDN